MGAFLNKVLQLLCCWPMTSFCHLPIMITHTHPEVGNLPTKMLAAGQWILSAMYSAFINVYPQLDLKIHLTGV